MRVGIEYDIMRSGNESIVVENEAVDVAPDIEVGGDTVSCSIIEIQGFHFKDIESGFHVRCWNIMISSMMKGNIIHVFVFTPMSDATFSGSL